MVNRQAFDLHSSSSVNKKNLLTKIDTLISWLRRRLRFCVNDPTDLT